MAAVEPVLRSLVRDLGIGILFCTRLPLGSAGAIEGKELARASWALPVAGAIPGLLGALVYWLAWLLALSPASAAVLAVAATLLVTGGLHEDGLADTADGFGGGRSRERKLEIMRDSAIGTYGVCALATSLALRWSALAALADPLHVAAALVAAHVAARAVLPIFMRLVGPARSDGLSATAGRPPRGSVAAAAGLGAIGLGICIGPLGAIACIVLLALAALTLGWLALRQIGGQTGDVVGALEQASEVLVLLVAGALHGA
jgi:adenosylcobinamide-GDP ribazoletransferase